MIRNVGVHVVVLTLLITGCAKQQDLSRYFQPWNCSSADDASDLLDAGTDGRITEADLAPGESAVQFRWIQPEQPVPLVISRRTDSILQINPNLGPSGDIRQPNDDPVWGIWHRVACDQDASLFLWFRGVAEPAELPLTSVALDIPALEQGGPRNLVIPANTSVRITETTLTHLSGHMTGTVDIPVHSRLTDEFMDQVIRVEGFAFNRVLW